MSQNPTQNENTDQVNTKNLLHKCLSQFSCQQQIHGQQAVHYLQGNDDNDDTIMFHPTIPMFSSLLLSHIHLI